MAARISEIGCTYFETSVFVITIVSALTELKYPARLRHSSGG
jgi:hypothetical protein